MPRPKLVLSKNRYLPQIIIEGKATAYANILWGPLWHKTSKSSYIRSFPSILTQL